MKKEKKRMNNKLNKIKKLRKAHPKISGKEVNRRGRTEERKASEYPHDLI